MGYTGVEAQIKAFDIHADELKLDIEVDSERAIWIMSLPIYRQASDVRWFRPRRRCALSLRIILTTK